MRVRFDCELHGAYEEDSAYDSSSDEIDWEQQDEFNYRNRITISETRRQLEFKAKSANIAYDGSASRKITEYLGKNWDGSISGVCHSTDPTSPIPDDTLCSPHCFWLKTNRTMAVSNWSSADKKLFDDLLPHMLNCRRGPCILAFDIKKSCREIFTMMLHAAADHQDPDTNPPQKQRLRLRVHKGHQHWKATTITHDIGNRPPFQPCSHEGTCKDADCSCFVGKVACEPTCACPRDCERRFNGCTCVASGAQTCWQDERCDCFMLNRECDPAICGGCGVLEKLDPVNRFNDKIQKVGCRNAELQRGVPKNTWMGNSEVQGWGLFAGQDIKKNEFIGEYKGELLSEEEMRRRGAVYHFMDTEYLFRLNKGKIRTS